jgi:hypothetical protein
VRLVDQVELPLLGEEPHQPAAIGVTRAGARARHLEGLRNTLLQKIAAARAKQERLVAELRRAGGTLLALVEPLMQERRALEGQIHDLFRAILQTKGRSKRALRSLRGAYEQLQREGFITPLAPGDGADGLPESGDAGRSDDGFGPDTGAPETAVRPAGAGELRSLFRRLAEALHPDRATDDASRVARTEVMKEVTAAYHAGDYSRLLALELEAATSASPAVTPRGIEAAEQLCAAIERSIAELRHELREVEHATRAERRSPQYQLIQDLKRFGAKEAFVEQARAELDSLRGVRDFVQSFVDGKVSLDEFLQGPTSARDDDPWNEEVEDDLMLAMALLADEIVPRPRRASGRKAAPRRRRR